MTHLTRLRAVAIAIAALGSTGCTMLQDMHRAQMTALAQADVPPEKYRQTPADDAWDSPLLALSELPEDRTARPHEAGAPIVILDDTRRVTHTWPEAPSRVAHQAHLFGPMSHVDVRRSLLILTQAGVQAARVEVRIPPKMHLSGFDAVTTLPDGREVRLKAPRLVTLARHAGEVPARVLVFAFPHAAPGAIVRWRYRISGMGYRPLDTWRLPEHLPVRSGQYTLKSYDFVAVASQTVGVKATPEKTTDSKRTRTWTVKDLPWAPREPYQAAPVSGRARVTIVVRDVDGHQIFPDWAEVVGGLQDRAGTMFAELPVAWWSMTPPKDARPAAALRLVQRDLALGSTPLVGRLDTLPALHRYRRGTPMEHGLATLMVLRHWDVDCDVVYTTPDGTLPILRNFPRPHRSAHLVLKCGDTLVDPSCQGCAAGTISPALRGRPAVRLVGDEVEFMTLPDAQDAVVQRRLTVKPQARGLVAEAGTVVVHGAHAARVRAWFARHPLPPKAQSDAARREFLDDIEAESIGVVGLGTPDAPIRFELTNLVVSRNGWTRTDQWMAVPFDALFSEGIFALGQAETRTAPVRLRHGAGFDNRVDLQTPPGWTVAKLPEPFALESPFGAYQFTVETGANGPVFVETLAVKAQSVDAARWPALRAFLRAIQTHRQRLITWRKEG